MNDVVALFLARKSCPIFRVFILIVCGGGIWFAAEVTDMFDDAWSLLCKSCECWFYSNNNLGLTSYTNRPESRYHIKYGWESMAALVVSRWDYHSGIVFELYSFGLISKTILSTIDRQSGGEDGVVEGVLTRKHEWESTTKKASNRSWDKVYWWWEGINNTELLI